MTAPSDETLFAYLESELAPAPSDAALEAFLDTAGGIERLAACRDVIDALSAPLPIESVDLLPTIQARLAESVPKRRPRWPLVLATGLAAAAALLLWMRAGDDHVSSDEFRAKSAGVAGIADADADRWVGLSVFRARDDQPATPVAGAISGADGLLFAYTNLGEQPQSYLTVVAVDAAGTLHWYYPDVDSDPSVSIAVEAGGHVELPDLIRHPLAIGSLTIYGVFSRRPLALDVVRKAISEVEPGARLPIQASAQQVLRLEVLP